MQHDKAKLLVQTATGAAMVCLTVAAWYLWYASSRRVPFSTSGSNPTGQPDLRRAIPEGWRTEEVEVGPPGKISKLTFAYPPEYCVATNSRTELSELYRGTQEWPENIIDVIDPREGARLGDEQTESPCFADQFQPGAPPLLSIQVFQDGAPTPPTLSEYIPTGVKVELLPAMAVGGHGAVRFIAGDGSPGGGPPFYFVIFRDRELVFELTTSVQCAAHGDCWDPQDRRFLAETVDPIIETMQVTR